MVLLGIEAAAKVAGAALYADGHIIADIGWKGRLRIQKRSCP